mmetsp:Transcript_25612/g.61741  ORF Transcript_25612/g.61741 Transcript_25612/m.61741 type:complete len:251 (+) Transcript_25612:244-996(+)
MGLVSSLFPSSDPRHTLTAAHAKTPRPAPGDIHKDSYFLNEDGLYIFVARWLPKGKPKALCVLLHGSGDHCGRLFPLAELLQGAGYAVCTMDHQGNGRSEGERMHVERYKHYVRDVNRMVLLEVERDPTLGALPRFLFGHSAGAVIALDVAKGAVAEEGGGGYKGLVLTSPMLYVDPATTSAFNLAAGRFLSNVLPKWPVPWVVGPDCPVSSNGPAQAAWDGDPLVCEGGVRACDWGSPPETQHRKGTWW